MPDHEGNKTDAAITFYFRLHNHTGRPLVLRRVALAHCDWHPANERPPRADTPILRRARGAVRQRRSGSEFAAQLVMAPADGGAGGAEATLTFGMRELGHKLAPYASDSGDCDCGTWTFSLSVSGAGPAVWFTLLP